MYKLKCSANCSKNYETKLRGGGAHVKLCERALPLRYSGKGVIYWKLDLAATDLAENLGLKDTLQKIWATTYYFYYISPLKIAEILVWQAKFR